MQEKRCSFSAVVLDGRIYVIGGHCDPDNIESVERYCPLANTWRYVGRDVIGSGSLKEVTMEIPLFQLHFPPGSASQRTCSQRSTRTGFCLRRPERPLQVSGLHVPLSAADRKRLPGRHGPTPGSALHGGPRGASLCRRWRHHGPQRGPF